MPDLLRDGRTRGWFHIDNALIDRYGMEIGAYGVAVYAVLARHADAKGVCFPSYQGIADRLGISRRQVIRTVAALAGFGLIRIQTNRMSGTRPQNVYVLTDDWCISVTGASQSPVISAPPAPGNGDPNALVTAKTATGDAPAPKLVTEMHPKETQGTRPKEKTQGRGNPMHPPAPLAARIPDDFSVSEEMYAYAARKGADREAVEAMTERFTLYWQTTPRDARKTDWAKAWQSWFLGDLRDGKLALRPSPHLPHHPYYPKGATDVYPTPDPTDHGPFACALGGRSDALCDEVDAED